LQLIRRTIRPKLFFFGGYMSCRSPAFHLLFICVYLAYLRLSAT
jgi:hypothetical protein